jgi:hypothetical protein
MRRCGVSPRTCAVSNVGDTGWYKYIFNDVLMPKPTPHRRQKIRRRREYIKVNEYRRV